MPLGYTRSDAGHLVPSADALAVQHMFQLYMTGQHSDTTSADQLNAHGYRTLDWSTGARGFGMATSWLLPTCCCTKNNSALLWLERRLKRSYSVWVWHLRMVRSAKQSKCGDATRYGRN